MLVIIKKPSFVVFIFATLFMAIAIAFSPDTVAQITKIETGKQLEKPGFSGIDFKSSHMDEVEFTMLSELQQRVQERVNEIKSKGYGAALLVQPFSQSYRLYKFRVVDNLAVQDDLILGPLRAVVKQSISNRDAGYKAGDPVSKAPTGSSLPPPLIPDAAYRWTNGVMPYEIKPEGFTVQQISLIRSALESLDKDTNLTIREKYKTDKDYVLFVASPGLEGSGLSALGKQGNMQEIWLKTNAKDTFGESTVLHEMLHAAGFGHEQNRADRDQFVRVLWKNIKDGQEHNFEKDDSRTFGTYDYKSIMHYSTYSFGKACALIDYQDNNFCRSCSLQNITDFLAMGPEDNCLKKTLGSKTQLAISRSSELTAGDIAAVNAAYPPVVLDKIEKLPSINTSRTFSLTLEKITRVAGTKGESSALCGSKPDFIGELIIADVLEFDNGKKNLSIKPTNEVMLSKTKRKDKHVGDTVTPNWKLNMPVGPGTDELYIIVKVWEYDDATCGGKDDVVDISPQNDQGFLRLLVNLATGEIQHLKPQYEPGIDQAIFYQRARQSGYNIFDSEKETFVSHSFSGLEDGDATQYQMEASVTLLGTIQ